MNRLATISLLCSMACFQQHAFAHSTVSELAELSLEDLLTIQVDENRSAQGTDMSTKRWSANFGMYSHQLGGYKRGSESLGNMAVMAVPSQPRTDYQYAVLATEISQIVFTAGLSYRPTKRDTFSITLPYVRQKTDHKSIFEDYASFSIDTEGLGDVGLSWRNKFYQDAICHFSAGIGLSLPTGSIDEQGDTPRAPGDQQLPYTMQLGSGTYDAALNFGMSWYYPTWTWVTDLSYVHRLNKNDRDYKLGDRFSLATSMRRPLSDSLSLQLGASFQTGGSISGSDLELEVPGPFPYPASITDPSNFGGEIFRIGAGVKFRLNETHSLSAGIDGPIYQHVNGVQPKAKSRVHLNWTVDF